MANTQASVLRQAVLGQPQPSPEEQVAASGAEEAVFPWEKTRDAELGSAVVRPPTLTPIPRSAPGHAGHMKLLFENAPVAMAMFDTSMRYLLANRRWLEDFKLADTDVTGRSQYELFPTLHPGWRHVYERALGGQIVRSDRDAITQDGRPVVYRWEVRPWRHVDTTIGGVMISCERLYSLSGGAAASLDNPKTESAGESLWRNHLPLLAMNAEGRIVRASQAVAGLLRGAGAGGGSQAFWQAFGETENQDVLRRHVLAALNSVLTDGRTHAVIFSGAKAGNAAVPVQWLVSKLEGGISGVPGDLALVVGLPGLSPFSQVEAQPARDDSHLPQLTAELTRLRLTAKESTDAAVIARQREARLRAVLDLAPCGLMVLDEHARAIYHNTHVAALLGRELQEGRSVEEWLVEGTRDESHLAEINRRWSEGVWRKNLTLPLALTASDGLLKEIEMRPVSLPGGGLLVMMQDVTESRRSEEVLRSTEAKYRTLVHESPVPVVLADRSGAVFDVNPAAEALIGHTRADLRRMSLENWLDPESLALRTTTLQQMQEHGERSVTIKVRVIRRSGDSFPAELRLAAVMDSGGQALFTVHFFSPIKEEPPTTAASPVASAPHASTHALLLLTADANGRINSWSDDACERFGYGESEVMGRGLHTLFRPSDATGFYADILALDTCGKEEARPVAWAFFHKTQGRQSGPFLVQRVGDTGLALSLLEEITVLSPTHPVEQGAPPAPTVEQPQATPADDPPPAQPRNPVPVKPSAGELSRERLLLGETHHRVKNHLQIITSMLSLQMSTLHNDEARDALRSSQNRVRSIAALHQHLYHLATGAADDFQAFAAGLIAHLRECYQVTEERVQLQLHLPDKAVPEEWLMPLALSLNEMISNAFKHAFTDRRRGNMRVALSWDDQMGELTVVDDGAGLPAGFTHHDSAGLGLKILRVFAGQLGGEVKIHSAPGQGAVFQLLFPVVSDDETTSVGQA